MSKVIVFHEIIILLINVVLLKDFVLCQQKEEYEGFSDRISHYIVNHEPYNYSGVAQVAKNGETFLCFGSLLSDKLILTSAQCLTRRKVKVSELTIYLGSKYVPHGLTPYNATNILLNHPNHTNSSLAIIELKETVNMSEDVAPVKLPENTDQLEKKFEMHAQCATLQWGTETVQGEKRDVIIPVEVNIEPCYGNDHFCGISPEYIEPEKCTKFLGSPLICDDHIVYGQLVKPYNCFVNERLDSVKDFLEQALSGNNFNETKDKDSSNTAPGYLQGTPSPEFEAEFTHPPSENSHPPSEKIESLNDIKSILNILLNVSYIKRN